MAKKTRPAAPKLVLGWKVTKGMDPEYWLEPGAKPGGHLKNHLETVAAQDITQHTMIVAQSGSGKSFFLGRLIEEIVLRTRCQVLVLDPNSDFRKIYAPTEPDYWKKKAKYDTTKRRGFLPDEASRAQFWQRWKPKSKKVYTAKGGSSAHVERLVVNWHALSIDWLFRESDPARRTELWHFHRFMHLVTLLLEPAQINAGRGQRKGKTIKPRRKEKALLDLIKKLSLGLAKGKGDPRDDMARMVEIITNHPAFRRKKNAPTRPVESAEGHDLESRRDNTIDRAASHMSYVSPDTVRYYFSVLHERRQSDLFTFHANRSSAPDHEQIRVVDLPSIDDDEHRAIIVSYFLEREWNEARERWRVALSRGRDLDERVPVFIVVDEAHNFVFAEARNPTQVRLQEQFRRIAAEGRKFGLFLILVTQRPDKIDRWVVSEMENRALMKIGSDFVLRKTGKLLGLNSHTQETSARCLEFDSGRVMLIGPWAGKEDRFLYGALRRTEEGGRNLREESWMVVKR